MNIDEHGMRQIKLRFRWPSLRHGRVQFYLSLVVQWLEARSTGELFVAFYALAFSVRLSVCFLAGIASPFVADAKEYFDSAVLLVQGNGYARLLGDGLVHLSAKRVPGTSLFLALGVLLFGEHEAAARVTAIVVSSFSAPLMYLFALRVAPKVPATLAALSCVFYPSWVFYSTTALSEPFLVPLVLLSLLLSLKALDSGTSRSALSAGIAWGAATLVRPVTIPMAGLVALHLGRRSDWKRGMLLCLGLVVPLSPWLARNYFVFGHPLIANQGGEVFLGANNPEVVQLPKDHGNWINPMDIPEYRDKLKSAPDEVSLDRLEYQLGQIYLRQNPRIIPRLVFYKLQRWLTPITDTGGKVRILVLTSYGVLWLLLVVGLLRRIYVSCATLALVVMWSLVQAAFTVVYWGFLTRGRLLLELVWLPWACLTVWDFLARILSRSPLENSLTGLPSSSVADGVFAPNLKNTEVLIT